jgi:peptidoglycan/xylan/chitin deacetylase (PgdA/CDA1 family)
MATEIPSALNFRWPNGVRLPVLLTFEHQSGEGTPLRAGDRVNFLIGGQIEYGARRGVWNILEELDKLNVKGTYFVSGNTAEK